FFDNMGERPITAATWKPYEITGLIDADAQYLTIGLLLLGTGKAWMDGVRVEVFDGKSWTPVPADHLSPNYVPTKAPLDPKLEKAIVAQIKANAIPLTTVEAGHGFDDLAPLDKIVGDARIVALGEASHGTREFFQMKHRLLEYLVNKKGFTVFAIEANWPESEVADRYIKTGEGDPTRALDAMYFWTWHTKEVADMIQWMRDYNQKPGDHPTLTFTSFDMQTPNVAARLVHEYFAKADKASLPTVQAAYARYTQERPLQRVSLTPEVLKADRAHAEEVLKLLDSKRSDLVRATSEADFRHARQCALIVQQAATMNAPQQNPYEIRDRSMAENVRWLAEEAYPNQKIVLWAHNGHIGDDLILGAPTMGRHLRKMYGTKMVTFGFGFDFGEIRASTLSGDKFTTGPIPQKVPPAMAGSAEAILRQAGSPRYLLDLRSISPTSSLGIWLAQDQLFREPGAAYAPDQPQAMFSPTILSKRFDNLIFIAESHASVYLPPGIAPKK
ncbi:MAG: hypothetical protein JWN14_4732, partial [Chthonomonadales bacterium]|nr:hypothetical protein [Chthonomonadales bacterium]